MELVDKEDDLARGGADLVHDALHALFEFAAILRARNQTGEIERDDAAVAQRLGNIALDHALGEALGDGGLADAGFADQRRVVLRPPGENLDDAFDFVIAANHRVQLVIAGQLREVAAVRVERGRLALALRRGRLPLGAQQRRRLHAYLGRVDPQVGQNPGGDALALTD